MPIALVRIDDRLVHGQVVESWIPNVRAQVVAVVSDATSADAVQQALMRLALPPDVRFLALSVRAAVEEFSRADESGQRILVLAPGPREVLALLEGGVRFDSVNVGGLHYSAGRIHLGKVIFLSEEDRGCLRAIAARQVSLEGRAVPSDAKTDITGLLEETHV